MSLLAWQFDDFPMEALEAMLEHWAIDLLKNVNPDLYSIVRPNTDDIRVKRAMVEFAQCQPVWHHGKSFGMTIRQNVRRF